MSLTLDQTEFQRALRQYAAVSSRDWQTIVNMKARDMIWRAVRFVDKARVGEIRALKNQPWWPKFIASISAGLSKAERARKSRAIINARAKSAGYMRAGLAAAGTKFADVDPSRPGRVRKTDARLAAKFSNTTGARVALATIRKHLATFAITYAARGGSDSATKRRMIERALQQSANFVIRDMGKYIERKMVRTGRRFSAISI